MPKRSLIEQVNKAVEQVLSGKVPQRDPAIEDLARVTIQLRELPREDFKASLKKNL